MVRREIEVAVGPAQLWEMLTDPTSVSAWLGGAVVWAPERWAPEPWTPEPGTPAPFNDTEDGDRDGRILEVAPERHLRFAWWPESRTEERSEVEHRLEPADSGMRLVVTDRWVGSGTQPRASAATAAWAATAAGAAWDAWDQRLAGMWSVAAPSRSAARPIC